MTNAHSLPLLRIPSFALIYIIQSWNVREQYNLSKLSKRCAIFVKTSVKKQCFELDIKLKQKFPVKIEGFTARNEYRFNLRAANGLFYPELESIKNFIVQVADVFSNLSISLDFKDAPHPRYLMDLIPLIKQLKVEMKALTTDSESPNDELCRFIFEECKDVKTMHMYSRTSPSFQLPPEEMGIFRGEQFVTSWLPWLTMDHLLHGFMNCKHVDLENLLFKASQLNNFLKTWIQGSAIQFFRCGVDSANVDIIPILARITVVPQEGISIRFGLKGPLKSLRSGFIIEQSNGVEGVASTFNGLYFVLCTAFKLGNGQKYGNYDIEEEQDDYENEVDFQPRQLWKGCAS